MNLPRFVWLLTSLIWGSTWLFIKVGLEYLPPFTFAGIRFVIAIIPLIILILIRRPTLLKKTGDLRLILFTGFLTFAVNYGLVFWGESHISSGLTAILYTTHPLFGLLFAHFYLPSEPMNFHKVSGVLIGIVGVAIIFSNQLQIQNTAAIFGAGAIVVASFVTAYAGILVKLRAGHIDSLVLTAGQMLVGLVPLLIIGFLLEGNPASFNWTPKAWLAIFYLALVGSALPFVLVYWLIKRMEVTKTQLIPLASTILAVLLGKLVFDEALTQRITVGAIAILLGLIITTRGYKRVAKKETLLKS